MATTALAVACGGPTTSAGTPMSSGLVYLGTRDEPLSHLPKGRAVATTLDRRVYLLPVNDGATITSSAPGTELVPQVSTTDGDGTAIDAGLAATSYDSTSSGIAYHPTFKPPDRRAVMTGALDDPRVVQFRGTGECSGAFVGPRHILTAAHCIDAGSFGWFVPDTVVPGRQGNCEHAPWTCTDGHPEEPWGEKAVESAIVPSDWIASASAENDYALLVLTDDASWGAWFGLTDDDPPARLEHAGFPSPDTNPCVESPGPAGSFYTSAPYDKECGGFAYHQVSPLASAERALVYTWHDVQGGHSGGPLYASDHAYGTLSAQETDTGLAVFRRVDTSTLCNWIQYSPSSSYEEGCH